VSEAVVLEGFGDLELDEHGLVGVAQVVEAQLRTDGWE
jgi:hypothetical protein